MRGTGTTYGATIREGCVELRYPAGALRRLEVELGGAERHGERRPLSREGEVFFARFDDLPVGTRYSLIADGARIGDPFARWLPEGPLAPAAIATAPRLRAPRAPLDLSRPRAFYELHVGTFTPEGTYRAATERLPHVASLGIDAIELMPLATFSGAHGWGYDGVAWLAPHPTYGTPDELGAFVDAAHREGLSVIVDVVLNHFGPEGSWLWCLDPGLFDGGRETPWGAAPDYRRPVMRWLAREVLRTWIEDYGMDGARLDATHAIVQPGEPHVLAALTEYARSLPGPPLVVAEDDRNDPTLLTELGLDALWADDLHHAVHAVLTREQEGYYAAYPPTPDTIVRTIERGWLYEGQLYAPWNEPRGAPLPDVARSRLIVALANHDQVGNRALGERPARLVASGALRGAVVAIGFLPSSLLLLQGEEWGASTPFLFFTDLSPELGRAVTEGRRSELAAFRAFATDLERATIPDPQAEGTFRASVLDWSEREEEAHRRVLELWRDVLQLRRRDPVLAGALGAPTASAAHGVITARRTLGSESRRLVWNLGEGAVPLPAGSGRCLLRSEGHALEPLAAGAAIICREEPAAGAGE